MSSVLIRGMEMPKNCKECMFADFDDVDFDYELYCTANGKYADLDMYDHPMGWDCPLVEIPTPHGRLGDLDELKTAFPRCDNSMDIKVASVRATINHAPTIIDAEGSEA